MTVSQVQEAWDRMEAWCEEHHPALLDIFSPGATDKQIAALEESIGHELPEDVRESLRRHNGQTEEFSCRFLLGQLALLSCKSIAENYAGWRGSDPSAPADGYTFYPEGAIAQRQYDPGWIPLASEMHSGNYLAVDLSPGPAGIAGQVITFGADIHDLAVLAPSFGEFLLSHARLLESGLLGEIDEDPDEWSIAFEEVWGQAAVDAIAVWVKDGRWPMREGQSA